MRLLTHIGQINIQQSQTPCAVSLSKLRISMASVRCAAGRSHLFQHHAGGPEVPERCCLSREEFVVVGWTDPEGSQPHLGSILLAYYDPPGGLVYAGGAGTGGKTEEIEVVAASL